MAGQSGDVAYERVRAFRLSGTAAAASRLAMALAALAIAVWWTRAGARRPPAQLLAALALLLLWRAFLDFGAYGYYHAALSGLYIAWAAPLALALVLELARPARRPSDAPLALA